MKIIKFCLSVFILIIYYQNSISQSAIAVGSGSYASYPPTNEYINGDPANGSFYDIAVNTSFNVGTAYTNQPIPTNDWYTSVVHGSENGLGGQLWSLPLMVQAKTTGLNVYHRGKNHWGYDALGSATLSADFNISIKGSGFDPTNTILENAGDWHTEMSLKEGTSTSQRIDFTLGLGMPYVWAHCVGFTPQIQAYHPGVRNYYDANGNSLSFPVTTDRFVIEYDGQLFGVHLSQNVNITTNDGGSTLTLNGYSNNWVVISALNSSTDLNYMHTYAFVRPTATTADYDYNSTTGAVNVTYNISKTNIVGSQANLLQGFMPHHYRGNTNNFAFTSRSYNYTPRGIVKLAAGTSFSFDYTFNGNILPAFKLPGTGSRYNSTRMNTIIDEFWANIQSGDLPMRDGTYWGGKDLVRLLKYTQFAKETGNSNYSAMLNYARDVFTDWATYTPGETERYFAYYPAWKGLVGFNEEFYSGYFTDNHFHLGYFVHAAALLDILSPGTIDGYWPIVEEVAKGYANWDKTDTDHLYFRTFNPFLGYSFADGRGNSIGNNQESSSESMQSWAAMFMVSQMTGNTAMEKAAAFGLTMESRAVADYWYNEGGTFSAAGYTKPLTGILEMNRFVYGTFFGAEETFIHGIQWLPISPFYSLWNDFLTVSEANALVDPLLANIENDLSARGEGDLIDWTNVLWGFKMFFDPNGVINQFESKWNAAPGTSDYNIAHTPGENGITYYYSHALSELGIRNTEYRLSLPLSSAFENGGTVNYVVYNPSSSAQTCNVYKNGTFVTSFLVPANTLYSTTGGTTPMELPSPWETADIGSVAATGSATYSSGTFTIEGSGADIWGTSDEFRYVYQAIDGDAVITAKVNSLSNTNAWAKTGVMIRESLTAGSKHAMTVVTAGNGTAFQRRISTNGTSAHTAGVSTSAPYWVKLERSGNTFTSSVSSDGTNWSTIGSSTISTSNTVYVGMVTTSHNDGTICTSLISDVTVTTGGNPIQDCTVVGATGDYTAEISNDASNPTITFVPARAGVGSSVCILYYGTAATSGLPGYNVTPNVPYQISAQNREHIYFYYTYSLPEGGENNTSASRNDFTVGNCSSLKSANVSNQVHTEAKDEAFADGNIRIYPNPGHSIIKVYGIKNASELSIYSLTGKELLHKKGSFDNETYLNIESLKKGVYFIKIRFSNSLQTKLFMKE